MCIFQVDGRDCKYPPKIGEYCSRHAREAKLLKKIKDQAAELSIINDRLGESNRKMRIIQECDRVKYLLAPHSPYCGFRQTILNPMCKTTIESIFEAPQSECINIYNDLLLKRNALVHKYTRRTWSPHIKKEHNRSIKELLKSVPLETII